MKKSGYTRLIALTLLAIILAVSWFMFNGGEKGMLPH
ncbi:hypothetical protein AEAC466_03040 [Asticcacaulis sp. AC466]|nr:hypothetical protein AEAC466_03040 [Asticcacaulis sp. AC466]